MFEIPEICMQYTEVFRTVRIEHGLTMIAGVLIGLLGGYLHGRD